MIPIQAVPRLLPVQMSWIDLVIHFADQPARQVDQKDMLMLQLFLQTFHCDRLSGLQRIPILVGSNEMDQPWIVFPLFEGMGNFWCGFC